jgi:hypothetical protein
MTHLQNTIELPAWARQLLASCPRAGKGVHGWLFTAALKLNRVVSDKDELIRMLREATASCGREVSDAELGNAVYNSARIANGQPDERSAGPRWPALDPLRVKAALENGLKLSDLQAASPVHLTGDEPHTDEIIDALFPGNVLLCAASRKERSYTRPREQWRGFLQKQQFIVPSPMSAMHGLTQAGERSMRTLANTSPRRFLVVEFDRGEFDQHAKLLTHLRDFLPLVLVVHSGNKSLHGWFYCVGQPDERIEKFFRYAVSLGADPATWTLCQLVRMPDGTRENGKRQHVVYFNPKGVSV